MILLIRTASCPSCGLSAKIAAATSVAKRLGTTFGNYQVNSADLAALLSENNIDIDDVSPEVHRNTCLILNTDNGNWDICGGGAHDKL